MRWIATQCAIAGLVEQAFETAAFIEGDVERSMAFAVVASALAEAGQNDEAVASLARAVDTIANADKGDQKATTLTLIARRQVDMGQLQQAIRSLSQALDSATAIGDAIQQTRVLIDIGTLYAETGTPLSHVEKAYLRSIVQKNPRRGASAVVSGGSQ